MGTFFLSNGDDVFPRPGDDNSGDDAIYGLDGNDSIRAGAGNDYVDAGPGRDTVFGGPGNDTIDAGILPEDELLDGGSGIDRVILNYQAVINLGTGQSVRVVAVFSPVSFQTLIDGFTGVTAIGFESMQISSGNNNDSIVGGARADTISSLGGNDTLRGGGGNDIISKTHGTYNLDGGAGYDTLIVSNTNTGQPGASLLFNAQTATIQAGTVTGGSFTGFERYVISGTQNADTIILGNSHDEGYGGSGNDLIEGRRGNDTLSGDSGVDTLLGGAGDDLIYTGGPVGGVHQADQAYGGDGDDRIHVATAFGVAPVLTGMRFDGGAGFDTLEVAGLLATLDLTGAILKGIERLEYSTSSLYGIRMTAAQANGLTDIVTGGFVQFTTRAAVVWTGELFASQIRLADGGQSFDMSASTRGADEFGPNVLGGSGGDRIVGSERREILNGGDGNDTIIGNGSAAAATGFDQLFGGAGQDSITGAATAERIGGGTGNDTIAAGGGNDTITGDEGNDVILADAGADLITGGAGRDTMTGGAGNDLFIYLSTGDSGATQNQADRITDFQLVAAGPGFVDRIDLSAIDAVPGGADDAFSFIGTDPFTAPGQVRVQQSGANTLVQINTAGAAGAEMVIVLENTQATQVGAEDFIL